MKVIDIRENMNMGRSILGLLFLSVLFMGCGKRQIFKEGGESQKVVNNIIPKLKR